MSNIILIVIIALVTYLVILGLKGWAQVIYDIVHPAPTLTPQTIEAKIAVAKARVRGIAKVMDYNTITDKVVIVVEEQDELYCVAFDGKTAGTMHKIPHAQGQVSSVKFLDSQTFIVLFKEPQWAIYGVLTGLTITYGSAHLINQ